MLRKYFSQNNLNILDKNSKIFLSITHQTYFTMKIIIIKYDCITLIFCMVLEVIPAIIVTIVIVGFGLGIHLTLGLLKGKSIRLKTIEENKNKKNADGSNMEDPDPVTFDVHKALRSIIVGSITALVLVLPQAENMGVEGETIKDIVLSVTLVATVAGIDAIAKKSGLGEK